MCETGPSPGGAWSPGRSQALGAQQNCSCQDGLRTFLERMGDSELPSSTFILPILSSSSEPRADLGKNQRWFLCHILLMCCQPLWYKRGLRVESVPDSNGIRLCPCFYRQNSVLELDIMSLDSNPIFAADLAHSLYLSELHFCQSCGMMVGSKIEKHRRDSITFSILLSLRRLSEFLPFYSLLIQ